jgi:cytochrome c peroxidase
VAHPLRPPSRRRAALLLAVGLALALGTAAAETGILDWSEDERSTILSPGPGPPAPARDASNRVSGRHEAIAFGRALFFDRGLSANGEVACASCHDPARGWADGRRASIGLAAVDRNAPGLANVRLQRWFAWDGGSDTLWAQSLRAILDPRELGMSAESVARHVRTAPALACGYARAFDAPPGDDPERVLVDVAKALAAFQETLASARTAFDDFRDALANGDRAAAARYPLVAQRGLRIFVGRGNCHLCHHGPNFTNGEFADIGIAFFVRPGEVDPGRHGGIKRLKESRYALTGRFNDDPVGAPPLATERVMLAHRNFGEFRVPSLRELGRTAPYMHAGSHATLRDVVRHYSELDEERLHADGERILRPLRLAEREIDDLVAFLETLTAPQPVVPALAVDSCR